LEKEDIDKAAIEMVPTPNYLSGKNTLIDRFIQNLNIVFYFLVNLIYDNFSFLFLYDLLKKFR